MTDPGLPLTTGEGNTAWWKCEGCGWRKGNTAHECVGCGEPKSTALLSRSGALADLSEALAERERLREQLAESEAANESYAVEATMAREQLDAAQTEIRHFRRALSEHHNIANLSEAVLREYDYRSCPVCARAALGVEGRDE